MCINVIYQDLKGFFVFSNTKLLKSKYYRCIWNRQYLDNDCLICAYLIVLLSLVCSMCRAVFSYLKFANDFIFLSAMKDSLSFIYECRALNSNTLSIYSLCRFYGNGNSYEHSQLSVLKVPDRNKHCQRV
ncbi:hypothetical protein C0J52_05341 [Blattella germanica]|nr:hypothetical protein C0J52_05341 [Blattella germanica]